MLLRFTTVDMLNTSLIDVATGERAFEIVTEQLDETPRTPSPSSSQEFSPTSSVVLDKSMPTPSTSSVHWAQQPDSYSMKAKPCPDRRHTTITDASGKVLVDVDWKGRRPDITICGEKIGGLTELFGSSTIRFMPKVLAIPTRFDTEFVWIATGDTLSLFDYDTDTVQGSFHQNCIRIPAPSYTPKSTFIPTHLPGVGSNYLEFSSHPLAQDVEVILSFLMMEILRRGRFSLTPYTFDNPTMWQFKDARESFFRRLRRNTV
ncbi:hypothetical protein FA13DRAFT_1692721 [Coprinellus micaceus]|uniref:Uncharacterized protein n=1 Tax=Coprinellus micaceus TaxID=71717 RepID=A0A4Y7SVT6_COPMI|nr:hypothetical protein FA13DRAFT_1692721 [Coprinellus micaceus]